MFLNKKKQFLTQEIIKDRFLIFAMSRNIHDEGTFHFSQKF